MTCNNGVCCERITITDHIEVETDEETGQEYGNVYGIEMVAGYTYLVDYGSRIEMTCNGVLLLYKSVYYLGTTVGNYHHETNPSLVLMPNAYHSVKVVAKVPVKSSREKMYFEVEKEKAIKWLN